MFVSSCVYACFVFYSNFGLNSSITYKARDNTEIIKEYSPHLHLEKKNTTPMITKWNNK